MIKPHELFAGGLLKIGWTCPNDAQWDRIKDFYTGQVGEVRKANSDLTKENKALKAEVYKIRGEFATTRAENLAFAMKLNKLESKDSTLHFNHKEG